MKLFNKAKKLLKSHLQEIIIGFLVLVFFVACSSFLLLTQDFSPDPLKQPDFVKWASPDETANYVFSKLYAQEGRIYLEENYNLLVDDIMRPRSFRSDHGIMKPISFLGIILIYGKIASFFSYKIIPFLTPLFASIGLIYYYLFVKKIFGRQNAFWSTIALAFFPPFVYYSMRSMFHNVLFTVLLLIGLYYAYLMVSEAIKIKKIKELSEWKNFKSFVFATLGGIFFGLAICTRTSELLWMLPMIFVLWVFNIRKIGVFRLLIFAIFLVLAVTPMLVFNHKLYGAYFSGGYPEMNSSIHTITEAGTSLLSSGFGFGSAVFVKSLEVIKNTIFHFGYDFEQSKLMFNNYFVNMFAWIFWPAIIGLALFAFRFKKSKAKQWHYLIVYLLASFILVVYYGSWEFHDNPDAEAVTIGNSYTRYWLPVYLGALPFATLFLMRISRMFCSVLNGKFKDSEDDTEETQGENQLSLFVETHQNNFCRNFLRTIAIICLAFVSVKFILIGSEEGIVYTIAKAKASKAEWQEVLSLTENNSAIVTRYHDKLFFPERKVVVGIFDDKNMNDRYTILAEKLPLYYYNFKYSQADIDYLNARRLAESNLHIELVKAVTDDFSLYRLSSTRK